MAAAPMTNPAAQVAGDHIRIDALTFDYGGARPAVDALSFDIRKGEMIGLLGPSGCGKSTTLRMFAGLLQPTSGRILINGQDIVSLPPWKRKLGLVFQSYALFPHMTVAQNVAFGLKLRKTPKSEMADRVTEALRAVHLSGYENRRPAELSGGQQQRVAIARAIVVEPEILLLDEPLSNLDARLRDEMRFEIRDIQTRTGITTLFVTHDQQEALTMCDRIAVMNAGELEQIGTPSEVYERPASRFVSNFIGRANEIACHFDSTGRATINGQVLPQAPVNRRGDQILTVRPHSLHLEAPGTGLIDATVRRRVFVGNMIEVGVELDDGQTLLAEVHPEELIGQPGERVALSWRVEDQRVFTA